MQSVETLTHRFEKHFQPGQAGVLAEVIHESYTDLVKTSDFTELKGIVADLATSQRELSEAQKRTEQRVEELSEAQKRTENRVEELAANQAKTEVAVRNLARQVGGLSESFGGSLEDFAIDIVPEILENRWNMIIESVERADLTVGGKTREFDLVIRGTIDEKPVLVLGEVKSNLTDMEAQRFLKITERFANENPSLEVRSIFFGYRAKRAAREAVKAAGAYMIFTHGKIV